MFARWVVLTMSLALATARIEAAEPVLVADAHVNSARPNSNSGAISNLNVGAGYTALLQFDLGTLPSGTTSAQIARAILRLYCNRADQPGAVSVQTIGSPWGEYSVTYSSLPSLSGAAQSFAVPGGGGYVYVDVTALVQSWLTTPASNNGVALTAASASVQFDSKENDLTGHAPALDVTLVSSGAAGPAGPQGIQGIQGLQGIPGAQGPPGSTGPLGPQGFQGPAGPAGAQGPAGPSGAQGPIGPQGPAGPVGMSFRGTWDPGVAYNQGDGVTYAGAAYVSLAAGNLANQPDQSPAFWSKFAAGSQGPRGETGPAGPAGPQGSQGPGGPLGMIGPQGPQGIAGPTGPQGPAGVTGPQGPVGMSYRGIYSTSVSYSVGDGVTFNGSGYISLINNNFGNLPDQASFAWSQFATGTPGLQGPAGPAGPQGAQGAQGLPGPSGSAGPVGAQGPTGPQGIQGFSGPKGDAGPQGPAGPVGMSFRGAYSASTVYSAGDGVTFDGAGYVSLASGNQGNQPDQAPQLWAKFAAGGPGPQGFQGPAGPVGATGARGDPGPAGSQGPQGIPGISFKGPWSSSTGYLANDAVTYNGSTYLATATSTSAVPDSSPTAWSLLARAGDAGPTGPAGAPTTIAIGSVTTVSPDTSASVTATSSGSNAVVLNFAIPRGAQGLPGTSTPGGGDSSTGDSFASVYHSVSFSQIFYSVNSTSSAAKEDVSILTWIPAGCSTTGLTVYSQQGNTITVTLRAGTPTSMNPTALACSVATNSTCTVTDSLGLPANSFVDFQVSGANGSDAGVWTLLSCR